MGFSDILGDAIKGIPLAEVLRERLALADQQFSALDRDFTKLKREKEQLEAENQKLRSDLEQRAEQIHALEIAGQKEQNGRRSEQEEKILLLLTGGKELTVAEIAGQIGTGTDRAEVFLLGLYDADLINCKKYSSYGWEPKKPNRWCLFAGGKKYLADHGLIS